MTRKRVIQKWEISWTGNTSKRLTILSPFVLLLDLCLLLGSEIVDDVEELPDLLGSLALDHVSDGLASNIEEGLDVEVVGSEDDLEEHLLVYGDELLVPFADIGGAFSGLVLVLVCIGRRERLATVVLAVLKNLLQDARRNVGERDRLVGLADVFKHVPDKDGTLNDVLLGVELFIVGGNEEDHGWIMRVMLVVKDDGGDQRTEWRWDTSR